jgi:peroxiredoxin
MAYDKFDLNRVSGKRQPSKTKKHSIFEVLDTGICKDEKTRSVERVRYMPHWLTNLHA